jgi:hypothetical protein
MAGEYAAWSERRTDSGSVFDPPEAEYVILWDLGKKVRIAKVETDRDAAITSLKFSANGQLLAASLSNGKTTLVKSGTGQPIRTLQATNEPTGSCFSYLPPFVFSPDQRFALGGACAGVLSLWDLSSGAVRELKAHEGKVTALAFGADGKSFFSAGEDRKVMLWTIAANGGITKEELASLENPAVHLELHPTQPLWVAADDAGSLSVWNLQSRKMAALMRVDCSRKPCRWMVAAPNGLFDSSDDNWRDLVWRFDGDTFSTLPVSTFFVEYFRANLLARLLTGESFVPPVELSAMDRGQHGTELALTRIPGQPMVSARLTITPASTDAEIRDAKLFRNGMLTAKWPGRLMPGPDGKVLIEPRFRLHRGRTSFAPWRITDPTSPRGSLSRGLMWHRMRSAARAFMCLQSGSTSMPDPG